MCGITGMLVQPGAWQGGAIEPIAHRMAQALRHRGPDSGGTWADTDAGIALGHQRLAIVDLSPEGHQPMVSESGRYVISYNGEVFNFGALRAELEASGARFRGGSDTEVLLALIDRLGLERSLRRIAGMFAIALWDRQDRVLHLVRDRVGKKPLYVGVINGAICFASELKALVQVPGLRREIDPAALSHFLRRQYVPAPATIWKDVLKLPAGARLSISNHQTLGIEDLKSSIQSWWSVAEIAVAAQADPLDGSDADLLDRLETVLLTAVSERMVADVPLGAFLSGGVDSSLVVALMQQVSAVPVRTFTVSFGEADYDESAKARAVARALGTEHTDLRVSTEQARDIIPAVPDIYDEPFADASQIPTWHIARLARQSVTVCLSGDGGDESFAGYGRYQLANRLEARLGSMPAGLRTVGARLIEAAPLAFLSRVAGLAGGAEQDGYRKGAAGDRVRKLAPLVEAAGPDARYQALLDIGGAAVLPGNRAAWPGQPPLSAQSMDSLHRMMLADSMSYLPDDVLVKVDRATMAVALEARSPLLDHRVIELAWQLPARMKMRDGESKWALRRLLERHIPAALVDRGKAGFGVPIADWLRGPLRGWAEELLDPRRIAAQGLLDGASVQAIWAAHLAGQRNFAPQLWSILMFQAWYDRWMPGIDAPARQSAHYSA